MSNKWGPKRRPSKKITLKLTVVPEAPEGTSVLKYTGEGTVAMKGPGSVTFVCGSCEAPLLVGISASQVRNLVFQCKGCGAFNRSLN